MNNAQHTTTMNIAEYTCPMNEIELVHGTEVEFNYTTRNGRHYAGIAQINDELGAKVTYDAKRDRFDVWQVEVTVEKSWHIEGVEQKIFTRKFKALSSIEVVERVAGYAYSNS